MEGATVRLAGARSIDDVVARLDAIIADALRYSSRRAYFATLYREMTLAIKRCIDRDLFQDGPRMEALDVAFANRYFEAYDAYRQGRPITGAWLIAFQAAESKRLMILQHLLLGINAHINLDLGVSAGQLCPGGAILDLRDDFDQINVVIEALVDDVQGEINQVSPLMRLVDWLGGRQDERLAALTIQFARAGAWDLATRLAPLEAGSHERWVLRRDQAVYRMGERICRPGLFLGGLSRLCGALESSDIGRVVSLFDGLGERCAQLIPAPEARRAGSG